MNVFILAIIGFAIFLALAILRKWFDSFILIAFSIGAACNANFYHALSTPVPCGPFIFAIDSILFTLFMHTLIVKYLHYSLKDAKNMAIASVVAIVLSAIFEFLAKVNSWGYSNELLFNLFNYLFSALGSLAGIWLMFYFLERSKSMNVYLRISLAILIGSVINSTIYYLGVLFIHGSADHFWGILLGSYIGKLYAIGLSLLCYWFNGRVLVPTDLQKMNHHELEK
ncbi:MAG: hypothetical protein K6E21_01125 [Bacilli bacterium]|nr:hypothetical protein [Bacilli bacterium]